MFPRSLQDYYASEVNVSTAQLPNVLHHNITGFDVSDISRPVTGQNFPAWHICSAAWSIVLSRHTGQSTVDILTTHGVPKVESTGGDSSPWIRVQASVDEKTSFLHLLHSALKISEHESQLASAPTYSAAIIHPLLLAELPPPPQTTFGLTIQLFSQRRKTIQAICYYPRWLPAHYAKKLMDHFLHLLRHIINHRCWAALYLKDISMVPLQEELQLRQQSLPGRSIGDMQIGAVHQLVRQQARKTPSAPAVEGRDGDVISYRMLDQMTDMMAEDVARRLEDVCPRALNTGLAVETGQVIGIMLQRSPGVVVSILSCWKAGYAVVLVDPSQPASRNTYIIEDCGCPLLLVDDSWAGCVGQGIAWAYDFGALRDRVTTSRFPTDAYPGSEVDLSQDLFRPAWIRVTSGSTGRPKCSLHSHAAFGASIASYAGRIRASKTLLFFNPISSASGTPIWSFLTNGGCVCIPPLEEITADLAGCIDRYGIEDICITPSALALTSPDAVPSLKTISLVGEAVPQTLAETWSQHASLLIGYGATEMNSHALPFHNEPAGCLPPGHPLPTSDYSLYILQPGTTKVCPLYVPGEICLSSTYMCAGYINSPEATAQVFQTHPFPGDAGHAYLYRTGDLGMFIAPGVFILLGRVDFQFKIDGNRIQPEEVEAVINQFPHVVKSRVILAKSSMGRAISVCCVKLKETALSNGDQGDSANGEWKEFVAAAEQACATHLPGYMMPHRWLQFKSFPETPSAKTDTRALLILAQERLDQEEGASTGPVELETPQALISGRGRLFLDHVLEVLTGQKPDSLPAQIRDRMQSLSFIFNGGTSSLALRVRAQLRSHGLNINIEQLFTSQSLRVIASTLSATEGEAIEGQMGTSRPPLSVTEALLPQLPNGFQHDPANYESVLPTTMLQREMFAISILDSRQWIFYQFMDLSTFSCTLSQLQEAVSLVVAAKANLRTVCLSLDVPSNLKTIEAPDDAFDLVRGGRFVLAILKPAATQFELAQDNEIEEPEIYRSQDATRKWTLGRLLWRVTFLVKPRLLAWTFHHSIMDDSVSQNLSRDLYAILTAIVRRDEGDQDGSQAVTVERVRAAKPSIEQWVVTQYGTNGLDGSPLSSHVLRATQVWASFMADAIPTPISELTRLPDAALPALPLQKSVSALAYGEWCREHHVTPAALFHAATALTIARSLDWWRPHPPPRAEEVTYYRVSSNRSTVLGAEAMEGALLSISPMRVALGRDFGALAVTQGALRNWLATQDADPYYLDEALAPPTPELGPRRQRRWGNVLLNHISRDPRDQIDGEIEAPAFRGVVQDRAGFAMVWPFAAIELTVVEPDSWKADSLQLCALTALEQETTEELLGVFERILRLIVEGGEGLSTAEIIQRV